MHAEPHQPDFTHDPILDGRDSLRLVKLRLALTLITVALLPIAAVSPVVRAIAGEASLSHHLRLDADASATASKLGAELDWLRATTASWIVEADIVAAAAAEPDGDASTIASTRLATLVRRPSGSVTAVALVVGSAPTLGVRAAAGAPLDLRRLPAGEVSGLVPGAGDGSGTILVVQTAPETKNAPRRTLAAVIDLERLLAWAAPAASIPGRGINLVDSAGRAVATTAAPFDAAALPGQLLAFATDLAKASDGEGSVVVDGLRAWTVTVSAPIPLTAMPASALAALAILLLLLVGFTAWMARQILRPAARLEASRSRLRELYESAREAALRDSLTGLGNHRSFQETLGRMVEGSRRYGTPFSLVLLDVDEFKRINDSRGHAVGDQLLGELGDLIRSTIRLSDAGYRVGGDEFAILLPQTDADGAAVMANRLLGRALQERGTGTYRSPISFSAGITACPEYAQTRHELTAQADAALYRGKRAGRTVVTVYDPSIDHGHVDEGMRAELSSAISVVIESGMLTPVFQPIVDLRTGIVSAYEGLVRVPPESTFAYAGALFDAGEISGRVVDLDRAALDTVLAAAGDLDPTISISLNVSPRTLEAPEFNAAVLLAILHRHAMPPERVILELTERHAPRDPERLGRMITELQAAGVRIAADDVGAGNAGLRLLSQYRFDVVKVDLSLVQGSGQDQGLSILTSLVQMAGRLGAMTIAEGVETIGQLETIRRLGVTCGQGYLLGRPSPGHDASWIDLIALERDARQPGLGLTPTAALADGAQALDVPVARRRRSSASLKTSSVSKE